MPRTTLSIALVTTALACSGPSVEPIGPGPEPTTTTTDAATAIAPPPVTAPDAGVAVAPAPPPDAAPAPRAPAKPVMLTCSGEPAIYYVVSWPMPADLAGHQDTRQTVHDDGRWCYDGVGGQLTGTLTASDLKAVRKLLSKATWTLGAGEMCDAVADRMIEVADVANGKSVAYAAPCEQEPHDTVNALVRGVGKRTTSTCTETGGIVYQRTEEPLRKSDAEFMATSNVMVWKTGKWRVDDGGTTTRAGCLNADQRKALSKTVSKAKFVAAKDTGVNCKAIPNTTITIEAGSKKFSYASPCAGAPSKSLYTLINLVSGYTSLR
jgi:hypothetical protein